MQGRAAGEDSLKVAGKPRVMHVVDSLETGGTERLVHDLVLARGGERTAVTCLEAVGPFGESLRQHGIQVDLIRKNGGSLRALWSFRQHLLCARPDVVHCHNLAAYLFGALGARVAGDIPVIMTKHGILFPGTGMARRLERLLIRNSDVVAVSHEVMELLKGWLPPGARPVRRIPNSISMAPYENPPSREEARAQLGLPARAFIVGIVARITIIKGHVLLVEVLSRILRQLPDALLLIVGDGPLLPKVKARVQELGVEKSVMVLGERRDVPRLLAAMDVFCLPSEMEGMPMTVLEAMAAGRPVVASSIGGIPEVVEEGRTGLMVAPRAAESLEAALLALAKDPQRAAAMGRAGRERLVQKFSLESVMASYEELYVRAAVRRRG